jgi:UDP-2,3-diacylglucosamine pyrophosphatase LpxH
MDTEKLLNKGIVVHISDLHISSKTEHRVITLFSFISSYYKEFDPKPTIIITGDIVHGYDEDYNIKKIKKTYRKQYKIAERLLNEMTQLGFKIFVCPGNHDYPPCGSESFNNLGYICDDFFKDYYNLNELRYPLFFSHGSYDFIVMNSNKGEIENNNSVFIDGSFGKKQLNRFDRVIKKVGNKRPLFILMHHHPFLHNIPFSSFYDISELFEIVKKRNSEKTKNIIVACGHIHNDYPRQYSKKYINTILESCSSTAFSERETRINTLNFIEITPSTKRNKVVLVQAKIKKKKFGKVNENYKFELVNSNPIKKSLGLVSWTVVSKYICCGFV